MKYKFILIFFNIFLFALFLGVFLFPFAAAGSSFFVEFWKANWYLLPVFVLLGACFNSFYFFNGKLIGAAEKEDWNTVAGILERKLYKSGKLSYSNLEVLIQSYFVEGRTDKILDTEVFLEQKNKKLALQGVLLFAAGHLLKNNYPELEEYMRRTLTKLQDSYKKEWIQLDLIFALVLNKKYSEACQLANTNVSLVCDPVVKMCMIYFISVCGGEVAESNVKDLSKQFAEKISEEKTEQIIKKRCQELHLIVFSKVIEKSKDVIYF